MFTFLSSPASHSLRERRLLWRGKAEAQHALASPEVQGAANKAAALEAMKQARIEQAQQGVKGAIDAVAPETKEGPGIPSWKPFKEPWKPLRDRRPPSLNAVGKAAITTGVVLNPVGGVIMVGGGYLGWKAWKKLRTIPPFSWADRGVRGAVSAGVNTVKTVGNVLSYPVLQAGRLSANVLRSGINAGYATLDATLFKAYREVKEILNMNLGIKKKEVGPAGTATALMKHLVARIWSLPATIIHHPVGTAIVGLGLYSLYTNPSGFVVAGKSVWALVVKILEGLASRAAVPAIP